MVHQLVWTVFVALGSAGPTFAANVGCSVSGQTETCQGSYWFPSTFDVQQIPNVAELTLGEFGSENVLENNFLPLPQLDKLKAIRLHGFKDIDYRLGIDFLLNDFLRNVKRQVTHLELWSGLLKTVDASTFSGFCQLETLMLTHVKLENIGADSLADLCADSNQQLVLANFHVSSEFGLKTLDWSVFAPVAQSLRHVHIIGSSLSELLASFAFELPRVVAVSLTTTKLRNLPRNMLHSLDRKTLRTLALEGGKFCESDKLCRCQELHGFMQWVLNGSKVPELSFWCGQGQICGNGNALISPLSFLNYYTSDCTMPYHGFFPEFYASVLNFTDSSQTCSTPVNPTPAPAQTTIPSVTTTACPTLTPQLPGVVPGNEWLTVTCRLGQLTVSEEDPDRLVAWSAVFDSDNSLQCRQMVISLHATAADIARVEMAKLRLDNFLPVLIRCRYGQLFVDEEDFVGTEGDTISLYFDGDGTRKCQDVVYQFHEWAVERVVYTRE